MAEEVTPWRLPSEWKADPPKSTLRFYRAEMRLLPLGVRFVFSDTPFMANTAATESGLAADDESGGR